MYIKKKTIDDLLNNVFTSILKEGIEVIPTKGKNIEVFGASLILENPKSRLSQTESRGKAFSAIGEFLWYLSGSNQLDFIQYYLPKYHLFSDDGKTVYGAYGPRLFGKSPAKNQIDIITSKLQSNPDTRKAVLQIFDSADILESHKDVPCTCTMQFVIRCGKLKMAVHMRSNDAYIGLPHDIFSFTMLQEILARELGVEVGTYHHLVGSMHLYDRDKAQARSYLKEGFQSLEVEMPDMPPGSQWDQIEIVLKLEKTLREKQTINTKDYKSLNSYWKDIVLLLQIHAKFKSEDVNSINFLKQELKYSEYKIFVEDKLRRSNISNGRNN